MLFPPLQEDRSHDTDPKCVPGAAVLTPVQYLCKPISLRSAHSWKKIAWHFHGHRSWDPSLAQCWLTGASASHGSHQEWSIRESWGEGNELEITTSALPGLPREIAEIAAVRSTGCAVASWKPCREGSQSDVQLASPTENYGMSTNYWNEGLGSLLGTKQRRVEADKALYTVH